MHLSRLFSICLLVGAAACSGGGGKGGNNADAAVDTPPDMPPALTGLGQKCGTGLPACPANAPECFGLVANGTAYCSPDCLTNGTGKTNAQGQFPAPGQPGSLMPPPDSSKCTAAFTGTVGMPVCAVILSTTPMDNPLKANTNYTAVSMGCAIVCSSGMCPPGMTCNTSIGPGVCLPM
jgi:hypothetical protein